MDGLYFREIVESDFPMISEWWFLSNKIHLDRDAVPNHGFIAVQKDCSLHIPLAATFLFLSSNSKLAQIAYPVACPSDMFTARERHEAISGCIKKCTEAAVSLGYKQIISLADKNGLGKIYESSGFLKMKDHSFYALGITDP